MSDKKPTNSEIVKALDVCGHTKGCTNCPLGKIEIDNCQMVLTEGAIDLINRQQAENKKLQKFKAYFDFYYGSNIEILGIDENGDTTSFDEFYNCAIANAESIEHHIAHIIKTAKAKAYKECIEKAKEIMRKYCGDITEDDLDNLLKELVGEQPPLNDIKCKDCEYLEFELPYAVCSKAYKGIVAPDDSCGKGKLKELVGEENARQSALQNTEQKQD